MALVFNIFTFNMLEVFAKTDEVNFSADSSDFVLLRDELVQKGYRLKIYDVYRPQGYIAEHSGHSIGSTVDLTLFDMNTEKDVDMGGTFDYFGELSHPYYTGITSQQYANRMLLRDVMIRHGFKYSGSVFKTKYLSFYNESMLRVEREPLHHCNQGYAA